MPTIKPVNISAQLIFFCPKALTSAEVILSAAPLSATSFPSQAPNTITTTKDPRVSPIPLVTDFEISVNGIPSNKPVASDTTRKAKNGFNLPQVINKIRETIPKRIMRKVIWQSWYWSANSLKV